jgi:hypothetical protein
VAACHLTERFSAAASCLFEDLLAGKEMRILLQPESALSGKLVDSGGKPLAGVQVWLRVEAICEKWSLYSPDASCITDAQGRYRFPGLNRSFRYQVVLDPEVREKDAPRTSWIGPTRDEEVLEPLKVVKGARANPDRPGLPAAPELRCSA